MNEICLIINTNTSISDVWPMFFGELESRITQNVKKYIFVDNTDYDFGEDYTVIFYDNTKQYRDQLLECFPNVQEKYCMYIQEDYIFYDTIQWNTVCDIVKLMDSEKNIDFVKLMRGTDTIEKIPSDITNNLPLYYITESECYYTQGITLWNIDKLKLIFNETPNSHIGGKGNHVHFEIIANTACKKHCTGILYYNNENKRGIHHYDSSITPYIASAIVKGKWNISEYSKELLPLLKKYNINIEKRGIC